MTNAAFLKALEQKGFHFYGAQDIFNDEMKATLAANPLAMDALPTFGTTPNAGVPVWVNTFVDPDVTRIGFIPNKAVKIVGDGNEVQKGSWAMKTASFVQVEQGGSVQSYGDFSGAGNASANVTFEQRQNYLYQTLARYGELENEVYGLAKVAYATEVVGGAVTVLNKLQNLIYFYGVANMSNYGLLNDPSLPAPIMPSTKQAGGTTWAVATGQEIYNDIILLYKQLQIQAPNIWDEESEFVLALDAATKANLLKNYSIGTTTTGTSTAISSNVLAIIKESFPNLRIETAVQYSSTVTTSGENFIQLIALKQEDGKATTQAAYSEKLRTHRPVLGHSSVEQKMSQGSWGMIVKKPAGIASMLGI